MRITREALLKFARTTVDQRTRYNRHLICVYITGSLIHEDAMLGGAADVDLIFVHDIDPASPREILPVTDDVHFDIAHLPQAVFHQPRSLRADPWIGSFLINNPIIMHDTQHWFEFTQAVVNSQFNSPDTTMKRARPLAESARQVWMQLHTGSNETGPKIVLAYLKAIEQAANAAAVLTGSPLTERRFLVNFPARAQAIGRPGLAGGLVDLFTREQADEQAWKQWLSDWETAFKAAGCLDNAPAQLHPARLHYYRGAIDAFAAEHPEAAQWILLRTWTRAVAALNNEAALVPWQAALQEFDLDEAHMSSRLGALDSYLDNIEEALDDWGMRNGAQIQV